MFKFWMCQSEECFFAMFFDILPPALRNQVGSKERQAQTKDGFAESYIKKCSTEAWISSKIVTNLPKPRIYFVIARILLHTIFSSARPSKKDNEGCRLVSFFLSLASYPKAVQDLLNEETLFLSGVEKNQNQNMVREILFCFL